MSRRLVIAGIIVVVAAIGVWWWSQRGESVETAIVTRGSIDVTIQTVGTIQATGAVAVRPTVGGTIETLGVSAGDIVADGDVIAILDRAPLESALASSQDTQTQAEYALQLAEQRSSASPNDQQLRLEALNAMSRVESARRAVDTAQNALTGAVILAPTGGTVIELSVKVGDSITQQQQVARIADRTDLQLVADVDELDLPNVARGADVTFRLDAFPDREIAGTVSATAAQARVQGGATVFATTIDFEPLFDLDLRPGMNADVTIVTASRQDVLLIPERALKTVGERSFVTTRTGQGDVDREVILGYRSHGDVEVVEGLAEGDIVIIR